MSKYVEVGTLRCVRTVGLMLFHAWQEHVKSPPRGVFLAFKCGNVPGRTEFLTNGMGEQRERQPPGVNLTLRQSSC